MSKPAKTILVIAILLVFGVIGYIVFKRFFDKEEEESTSTTVKAPSSEKTQIQESSYPVIPRTMNPDGSTSTSQVKPEDAPIVFDPEVTEPEVIADPISEPIKETQPIVDLKSVSAELARPVLSIVKDIKTA